MRLASDLATTQRRALDQHGPLGSRRWRPIPAAGLRQDERSPSGPDRAMMRPAMLTNSSRLIRRRLHLFLVTDTYLTDF
jgi:hypothetical protein